MKASIYQLRISLVGVQPPIWRRVLVEGDLPLDQLSGIVQVAMGWYGGHLYSFEIDGMAYTDAGSARELGDREAKGHRLSELLGSKGDGFLYTYDFGDNWEHEIVVEAILEPEPDAHYPICVEGQRACPPEDVGGVWGYEEFLEAIQDPKHPEHEEMMEWAGDEFDPEEFDLDATNRVLRRGRWRDGDSGLGAW